jgi:histidinol phosphatase-like enzyme
MGRYTSIPASEVPSQTQSGVQGLWPTSFPKQTIGIDRNGIITSNTGSIIQPEQISIIPGSLEAIRQMRMKGYKVVIFFNEPAISAKIATSDQIDTVIKRMMELFGNAGIQNIHGLLYSTSTFKDDIYALPNTGMPKKAENDFKVNFKEGYFVGGSMTALKTAENIKAIPVLIKNGEYEDTLQKLDTFANKKLKQSTKQYNTLQEFVNQLS